MCGGGRDVAMTVRLVVRLLIGYGVLALSLASLSGAAAAGWTVQRTPNPPGARHSQLVGVSCASTSFCIAVGYSTHGGGALVALAERRQGGSWSMQRTPKPAGARTTVLSGVSCVSRMACTAVGYFVDRAGVAVTLAERWDGTSWSLQRTRDPRGVAYSYLTGVSCASRKSCTAVGSSRDPVGQEDVLAERWDGTRWSIQSVPNPPGATNSVLHGVSCATTSACTAVGDFLNHEAVDLTLAERWNGTSWAVQPSPNPAFASDSHLISVSCASISSCDTVGYFANRAGHIGTLAEHWDRNSWAIQPTPNPSRARTSQLFGVDCRSTIACAAIGNFANSGGAFVTLAERRKRTGWALQRAAHPAGATNSGLDAVACPSPRSCTAVGYFIDQSGAVLTLAERYS
jgi:hypothetical protein